jgi:hypothetical protein
MTVTSVAPAKKRTKSVSRRSPVKDARTQVIPPIRCTQEERLAIKTAADKAGLSVGAFMRRQALGSPGPRAVRKPPVERKELARLLGWLGKLGSNVNQLAHGFNRSRKTPGSAELIAIRGEVGEMRAALMKALGRDHKG